MWRLKNLFARLSFLHLRRRHSFKSQLLEVMEATRLQSKEAESQRHADSMRLSDYMEQVMKQLARIADAQGQDHSAGTGDSATAIPKQGESISQMMIDTKPIYDVEAQKTDGMRFIQVKFAEKAQSIIHTVANMDDMNHELAKNSINDLMMLTSFSLLSPSEQKRLCDYIRLAWQERGIRLLAPRQGDNFEEASMRSQRVVGPSDLVALVISIGAKTNHYLIKADVERG